MEFKKVKIVKISRNVTSKKGNKGSLITTIVLDDKGKATEERIVMWDNDPDYKTPYREVDVEGEEDETGVMRWSMVGNFLTEIETISIKAKAMASAQKEFA